MSYQNSAALYSGILSLLAAESFLTRAAIATPNDSAPQYARTVASDGVEKTAHTALKGAAPKKMAASFPGWRTTALEKTLPGGLKYIDVKVGKGTLARTNDILDMQYTGYLRNGKKFDSSYDHGGKPFPFILGVGQVIKGWDEGIVGMREGGKRKLIIPPSLGFGAQGSPPYIPQNATLVFDVELVKREPAPGR